MTQNIDHALTPAGEGESMPVAAVQSLQSLVSEMEQFLSSWMKKLDHEMLSFQCSQSPDHLLQKRFHEFEKEKRQWDAMRTVEAQRVHQSSQHLTAAWLQLEAEQKRWMQMKQLHGTTPLEAMSSVKSVGGDSAADGLHAAEGRCSASPPESGKELSPASGASSGDGAALGPSAATREAAARQFRRLRQQIDAVKPKSIQT